MSQTLAEKPTGQAEDKQKRSFAQALEAHRQDLVNGQPVILAMRWILVVSGLFLAIWNAESVPSLRLQIVVIILLAIANFYLQAQLLMKRQVGEFIIYGASAVDLVLITILVALQGGYDSSIYMFYMPAIAAFAVAFPTALTALYTAGTIGVYGMIATLTSGSDVYVVFTRLLMIAAVAFCGNLYLRLEERRRANARDAGDELAASVREARLVTE